jgi:hypothetical protein
MTIARLRSRRAVLAAGVVGALAIGAPAMAKVQPHFGPHPGLPPASNSVADDQLYGVSMVNADDGWAVGSNVRGQTVGALIEHWDGKAWTQVTGLGLSGYLDGVSADSSSDAWDGSSWARVHSPNPGGSQGSILESVTALSPTNAWAVGEYDESSPKTFIEHWNGKAWKESTSVDPGFDNNLATVTAVSPTDIWAAGESQEVDQFQTLVEHWDGSKWTLVSSPNANVASFLTGLSANSTSDVWAVGYSYTGPKGRTLPLTEHWDGSQWKVVPSPTAGDRFGTLLAAVSAVSASDVWACGVNLDANRLYMLHWDGTTWTKVAIPNPGGANGSQLMALDAVSPDDVWSVGGYGTSDQTFVSLHMRWDGTRWTRY